MTPHESTRMKTIVIAIDGPAAAGKGTLARKLAAHLDYAYLDTGALYRSVAYFVVQAGGDPAQSLDALAGAKTLNAAMGNQTPSSLPSSLPTDNAIRTGEIGLAAAKVAIHPEVRAEILDLQRQFAATPPDGKGGAVLDGRDIGTVVCPDADAKIFITASAEIRAHRRWLELNAQDKTIQEADVLADLTRRDEADRTRKIAPLKPAEDALLLDTSNLAIEDAFKTALARIKI